MGADDPKRSREAILARRRRFIIAAVGGVTAVAAIACDTSPSVCLEYAPLGGMGGTAGEGGDEGGQGGTGGPQACLDFAPAGMGGTAGDGGTGGAGG